MSLEAADAFAVLVAAAFVVAVPDTLVVADRTGCSATFGSHHFDQTGSDYSSSSNLQTLDYSF